ncbi:hypothetical protein [Haladaptatus sp. DYF46]|uniref:hypothetical protein n=1 Tax=Haladaptatus sp. DYF46 TaxID=2886041 RepID=UPI001E5CAB49|nr:hypothetical protein [Haladaptatus sp. DYF46]
MRVTHPDLTVADGESRTGGRMISLLGVLLSIVVVFDLYLRADSVWFPEFIIEMTLSAILIYSGLRLSRSDIEASALQRIDISCLKGMLALSGFAAGVIVTAKVSGWHIANPYFLTQTLVTSGALLGLVVGIAGIVAPIRNETGSSNVEESDSNTATPSDVILSTLDGSTPTDPDASEPPRLPVATSEIGAPSGVVDDWLSVLADRECRYVLRMAMDAPDGVLTVEELTETDELRRVSLETNLRHVTLPKLWDVHLIDYDDRTGTIRYDGTPAFEALFESVERYRE